MRLRQPHQSAPKCTKVLHKTRQTNEDIGKSSQRFLNSFGRGWMGALGFSPPLENRYLVEPLQVELLVLLVLGLLALDDVGAFALSEVLLEEQQMRPLFNTVTRSRC